MRQEVITAIEKNRIMAIVRGISGSDLLDTAKALYEGGIRLMEIAFSLSGSVDFSATAEDIHRLTDAVQGKILIGAGTVMHPEQVCLAYEAGARFILSPNTDARVIGKTRELQMVSIPGALTPTEMASAHEAGADFVKLFPAASLGAGYIRAIRAPMDHIRLVAVGGIDDCNAAEYLRAGACAVGVGGHLVDKALVGQRNFAALTERAERYLQAIGRM